MWVWECFCLPPFEGQVWLHQTLKHQTRCLDGLTSLFNLISPLWLALAPPTLLSDSDSEGWKYNVPVLNVEYNGTTLCGLVDKEQNKRLINIRAVWRRPVRPSSWRLTTRFQATPALKSLGKAHPADWSRDTVSTKWKNPNTNPLKPTSENSAQSRILKWTQKVQFPTTYCTTSLLVPKYVQKLSPF